jgi:signal peptidase II
MPGQEAAPRKPIYKDLLLLQLAALVFLLDQFSKFLVREFLTFREAYPVEGFFRIIHSRNTGSAFGIFRDQNGPLILVSLVGMTALALIYYRYRGSTNSTNLLRLSLGLQMGGAAGNLLDRVLLGHVIDFIDVGKWPVFNLADSSIVVGLVVLAWLFLRPEGFGGVKRSPVGIGVLEPVVGAVQDGIYARCPLCDGEMLAAGHGWHCSGCGVMERIDAGHGSPEPPVVVEQPAAARGNGPKPMGPTEAIQTSSVPPAEAPSSCELADGYMPEVAAGEATPPYRGDELGSSGTSRPL